MCRCGCEAVLERRRTARGTTSLPHARLLPHPAPNPAHPLSLPHHHTSCPHPTHHYHLPHHHPALTPTRHYRFPHPPPPTSPSTTQTRSHSLTRTPPEAYKQRVLPFVCGRKKVRDRRESHLDKQRRAEVLAGNCRSLSHSLNHTLFYVYILSCNLSEPVCSSWLQIKAPVFS